MAIYVKNDQHPHKKMGCLWTVIVVIGAYFLFSALLVFLMGSMMTSTATNTLEENTICLLYTSPSPRDAHESRLPSCGL